MKETFKIAALRQRSEDIIEIFSVGSQRVIILCDGAGGFGGGFEAATTCVSVVKDELLTKTKITQEDIYESIIKSCYKLSRGNIGQTTAIVLVVEGSVVIGASCGDSDAYMLMGEDIIHITEKQHNVRVGDFGIPVKFQFEDFDKIIVGSDGLWRDCYFGKMVDLIKLGKSDAELIDISFNKITEYQQQDDFSMLVLSK